MAASFDPDAYLGSGSAAFDPDTYLADKPEDHPIRAAAEGLFNTAALGFGNKILADSPFGDSLADIKARAAANPAANLAGGIAGMFTPGPGAVTGLARTIGGGSRLAVGGIEGGIWGLSAAMNEEHIGDSEKTSEHIAAGVLGGALIGGGVNTVFGKIGDLGRSALIKAFGGKALKGSLGSLAEEAVIRSIADEGDMAVRNFGARKNEVARYALDQGLVPSTGSMKVATERATSKATGLHNEIKSTLADMDQFAKFDSAAAASTLQAKIDAMGNNPAMIETKAKLQTFVNAMADVGTPASTSTANAFVSGPKGSVQFIPKGTVTPAVPGTAPRTFTEAWDTIKEMKDPDLYRNLRGELKEELFRQSRPVLSDPERLVNLSRAEANALEFRTLAGEKAAKQGYTMGDYATGAVGFSTGGIPGLVVPVLKRGLRERGGFVAASALDALARNGTLPKIANGFQVLMKTRLAMNPEFGGAFRGVLETAAAKGAMPLLETHMSLAQQHPDYMMSVGLEHEDPSTVAEHTDKANRLSQLSDAVDGAGLEMDKSVARMLGELPGRAPLHVKNQPTRAEFEAVRKKLEILGSNAENSAHLADLAPTTATLAQIATQNAVRHLLDTAPKNPYAGLPPALARPWAPPAGELRSWFRRVATVANPLSVLDSMRKNEVTAEQIETLQTVYPRLHKEFQEKLRERLSTWTTLLDRKRRGQAAKLLGDLDDPAVTQLIQAAHLRSIPPPAGAPDGREKLDVEKNQQTQAQRLEER